MHKNTQHRQTRARRPPRAHGVAALFFGLVLCCTATSAGAASVAAWLDTLRDGSLDDGHGDARTSSRPRPSHQGSPRQLASDDGGSSDAIGTDGSCHYLVATKPRADGNLGRGVLFAVRSGDDDDDGLEITSLGFHVDPAAVEGGGAIEYEVYVLARPGYYASPERNPNSPSMVSADASEYFDYRGKMDEWTLISEGEIMADDLTNDITTLDVMVDDFFQTPLGTFKILVPGNGGIRSFYIATPKSSSFVYVNTEEGKVVNDELELVRIGDGRPVGEAPEILEGEGVVMYPMPDTGLMYAQRSFLGKVYYERECSSLAPSLSFGPSSAPTTTPSDVPSYRPTLTLPPTSAPSVVASQLPSSAPSLLPTVSAEQLYAGLFLSLPMDCDPGDELTKNETAAVAGSVQNATMEEAAGNPDLSNIKAKVEDMVCIELRRQRRLVVDARDELSIDHRYLPTSSSAMDFSVVITGDYRPPHRPGEKEVPMQIPNLGSLVEDSINRNPEGFVKNIKNRAAQSIRLQQVQASEVQVEAVDVEEDEPFKRFTRAPTPTPSPTTAHADVAEIITVCIVVIGGISALLGAFLLFRYGQRRANKRRREEAARAEVLRSERREKARLEKQLKAAREGAGRRKQTSDEERAWPPWHPERLPEGDQGAYGYPPPLPMYYSGGAQPQNYGHGYGVHASPPPSPYGQPHGGPNPQAPPYPAPLPMEGSSYEQPPGSGVR